MTSMRRFLAGLAAALILQAGGTAAPAPVEAAEASCCWLYCETYRDLCKFLSDLDHEYCDAWFQGCTDGCAYSKAPPEPTF